MRTFTAGKSLPGTSGVALIFVSESGQNSIIVVPGANDAFQPQHVTGDPGQFKGVAAVLLQLENPTETVLAAAREGQKAGAKVILDPAPAPAKPLPSELFRVVDILTPNETEAAILAGLPPSVTARAAEELRRLERSARERTERDSWSGDAECGDRLPSVVRDLAALDLDRMSPLDAMNELSTLRMEAIRCLEGQSEA